MKNLHFLLIKSIIKKNKPTLISTGTLNFDEIKSLLKFVDKKIKSLIIMYYLTEYAAKYKNFFNFIKRLKKIKI